MQFELTQEHRNKVANGIDEKLYETSSEYLDALLEAIAHEAQKELVKWGEGACKEHYKHVVFIGENVHGVKKTY